MRSSPGWRADLSFWGEQPSGRSPQPLSCLLVTKNTETTRRGRSSERGFPPLPIPLPIGVPDVHTHLDLTIAVEASGMGPGSVAAAIALAAEANVDRIVQVGVDVNSSRFSVEIAEANPSVVATVALHPNEAPRLAAHGGDALSMAIREIEALAKHPRVRGIGETGLDYFRTEESGRGPQHECFRAHVDLAKESGKALVIHDRDAHSDVIKALDNAGAPEIVVMHCFSGDAEFAKECLRRGFFLSFAGNVTFKNAAALREALAITPSDRLLVETDAPFLTPVPHRGRANASYLIPITVRAIADMRGVPVETLCEALSTNAHTVFGPWSDGETDSDA